MSDERRGPPGPDGSEDAREAYEPPRLTTVGNARDLLAGASGTIADAGPCCCCPGQETQPSS